MEYFNLTAGDASAALNTTNATRYFPFGGRIAYAHSTQAPTQTAIGMDCSITMLAVQVTSNGFNAVEIAVQVNGSDVLVLNIGANQLGSFRVQAPTPIVVGPNDKINARLLTGSSGSFLTLSRVTLEGSIA